MRLLPILISLFFLAILMMSGCRQPSPDCKPVEYEQGLTEQAWLMLDTGAEFDEYIRVQQEAVRQLRAGNSRENPVAVLEQMAYFLFSAGRLEEALPYFNEALDSLRSCPWLAQSESAVMLYGDISQFCERLGMTEKALAYSDTAMAVSRSLGGLLMADLWRFRTQVYANVGRTDDAFACFDSAYATIRRDTVQQDTALLLATIDAERANLILSRSTSPDSVNLAVTLLKRIFDANENHDYTGYEATLGYGLYLRGDKEEGIAMMESAVDRLRGMGDLEMTFLEMRRLIEVYNSEHMFDRVSGIYNEYNLLDDSMNRARHNLELMTAKVRADVAHKESENRFLHEKLQAKHRQTVIITVTAILLVIAAVVIIVIVRRRSLRMKLRRDAERARRISAEAGISEALNERNSALERIKIIKSELSDRVATSTDILYRPQFFGNNPGPFLRAFNALYPRFADNLRRDYPSLTDTDVIFCMLIYLRHSTEEISVYLNISRTSVNSARYRIRSKFGLGKGDNLDKFLQEREG